MVNIRSCNALHYNEEQLRESLSAFILVVLAGLLSVYALKIGQGVIYLTRAAKSGLRDRVFKTASIYTGLMLLLALKLVAGMVYVVLVNRDPFPDASNAKIQQMWSWLPEIIFFWTVPMLIWYTCSLFTFQVPYVRAWVCLLAGYSLCAAVWTMGRQHASETWSFITVAVSVLGMVLMMMTGQRLWSQETWHKVLDEYEEEKLTLRQDASPLSSESSITVRLRSMDPQGRQRTDSAASGAAAEGSLGQRLYEQRLMSKFFALGIIMMARIFGYMCVRLVTGVSSVSGVKSAFDLDDFVAAMYFFIFEFFPWLSFLLVLWEPDAQVTLAAKDRNSASDPLLSDRALPLSDRIHTYVQKHWNSISMYTLFAAANLGLLGWGVHQACYTAAGHLGLSVLIAKSSAKVISFNMGVILLTVIPYLLGRIRSSYVGGILPMDEQMMLHKICAWVLTIMSIVHTVAHCFNYYYLMHLDHADLERYGKGNRLGEIYHASNIWLVLPVWTGIVLLVALAAVMVPGLIHVLYRGKISYETFFYSHRAGAVVMVIVVAFHGAGRYIAFPYAWAFEIAPVIVFLVSRYMRSKNALQVAGTTYSFKPILGPAAGRQYIRLDIPIPLSFKYAAGQYMNIKCDSVDEYQWHAMTICSADPSLMTFIIEVRQRANQGNGAMTWTEQLKATLELYQSDPHMSLPRLHLEGPFTTAASEAFNKEFIMLVATGTGITPMASLWSALHERGGAVDKGASVRFLWISPSAELVSNLLEQLFPNEFEALPVEEQKDLEDAYRTPRSRAGSHSMKKSPVGIRRVQPFDIYVTRAKERDPQIVALKNQLKAFGSHFSVSAGRPAAGEVRHYIDAYVTSCKQKHVSRPGDELPTVNIFFCGNANVKRVIHEQAALHTKNIRRSRIQIYAEHF